MRAQTSLIAEFEGRNRRLRRLLLGVAALLGLATIVYIALHRHV